MDIRNVLTNKVVYKDLTYDDVDYYIEVKPLPDGLYQVEDRGQVIIRNTTYCSISNIILPQPFIFIVGDGDYQPYLNVARLNHLMAYAEHSIRTCECCGKEYYDNDYNSIRCGTCVNTCHYDRLTKKWVQNHG